MEPVDLSGRKIGFLTVLRRSHSSSQGRWWVCQCTCGKEIERPAKALLRHERNGDRVSCGCHSYDNLIHETKHGLSKHPLHSVWRGIRDRCRNPHNAAWKWYGGKGIKVCSRWDDFQLFYNDISPMWKPGLTIDRIDPSKDYCPDNCRCITQREQTRNTTRNIKIGGVLLCDLAKQHGLNVYTVYSRFETNCPKELLFLPTKEYAKARAEYNELIKRKKDATEP